MTLRRQHLSEGSNSGPEEWSVPGGLLHTEGYFRAFVLCFEPCSNFYRFCKFFVCILIEEIIVSISTGKDCV